MLDAGRRQFVTLLGSAAAAWPLATRAQQTTSRVIGWFSLRSADTESEKSILAAFRQGLSQSGYIEGRNLTIEFGFADGRYDQLPVLAADLVRRGVEVLVTAGGTNITRIAQAATTTIPIIFATANDPITARRCVMQSASLRRLSGIGSFRDYEDFAATGSGIHKELSWALAAALLREGHAP